MLRPRRNVAHFHCSFRLTPAGAPFLCAGCACLVLVAAIYACHRRLVSGERLFNNDGSLYRRIFVVMVPPATTLRKGEAVGFALCQYCRNESWQICVRRVRVRRYFRWPAGQVSPGYRCPFGNREARRRKVGRSDAHLSFRLLHSVRICALHITVLHCSISIPRWNCRIHLAIAVRHWFIEQI